VEEAEGRRNTTGIETSLTPHYHFHALSGCPAGRDFLAKIAEGLRYFGLSLMAPGLRLRDCAHSPTP
jgi:hypothetical protein